MMQQPSISTNEALGRPLTEILTTPSIPEIGTEHQASFRQRTENEVVALGCGDDRGPAREARRQFEAATGVQIEHYLRSFGGAPTVAETAFTAAVTQYGPSAFHRVRFSDFAQETYTRLPREAGVLPTYHSAEKNEGGIIVNHDRENPLGCARLHSHEAVSGLATTSETVRQVSVEEHAALFGRENGFVHEQVVHGLKTAKHLRVPEQLGSLTLGRPYVAGTDLPGMVLAGDHAPATETFVCANFTENQISKPAGFYVIDATQVAEACMRAWPELRLDPKILLAVQLHDATATRAALAHGDTGAYDPSALALKRYGDPKQAVAYLEALRNSLGYMQ